MHPPEPSCQSRFASVRRSRMNFVSRDSPIYIRKILDCFCSISERQNRGQIGAILFVKLHARAKKLADSAKHSGPVIRLYGCSQVEAVLRQKDEPRGGSRGAVTRKSFRRLVQEEQVSWTRGYSLP